MRDTNVPEGYARAAIPLRAYIAAGGGAVIVGLSVMVVTALLVGVAGAAMGPDSSIFPALRVLVSTFAVILGLIAGRTAARWIMSALARTETATRS
jgi:hypothetical protein